MPWLGEADRRRHTKLLVREVISIAPVSADGMHVTWDTASYVALLQRAQREQLVLGIAHSHPKGGLIHYSSLSAVRDRRKVARASNLARPEKAKPRDGNRRLPFVSSPALPEWSIPVPGGLDANAIPRGRKLARASVSANPSFAPLGLLTGVAASPHGILLNLPTQSRAGLPLCGEARRIAVTMAK
jgi:hypothetical protein